MEAIDVRARVAASAAARGMRADTARPTSVECVGASATCGASGRHGVMRNEGRNTKLAAPTPHAPWAWSMGRASPRPPAEDSTTECCDESAAPAHPNTHVGCTWDMELRRCSPSGHERVQDNRDVTPLEHGRLQRRNCPTLRLCRGQSFIEMRHPLPSRFQGADRPKPRLQHVNGRGLRPPRTKDGLICREDDGSRTGAAVPPRRPADLLSKLRKRGLRA